MLRKLKQLQTICLNFTDTSTSHFWVHTLDDALGDFKQLQAICLNSAG